MTATTPHEGWTERRPKRRRALWLVLALAVVALVGVASTQSGSPGRSGVGGQAPMFTLANLVEGGAPVDLTSFRGRPVVVNFWASWCVPCRREMPGFQAVSEQFGDRVAFVGVNHEDGRGGALDLVEETGVRYPSGYDPKGKLARAFGLRGMPTTVFIGPDGAILEKRTGEISRRQLEETVTRLFGA